jgi:hypothetical protein
MPGRVGDLALSSCGESVLHALYGTTHWKLWCLFTRMMMRSSAKNVTPTEFSWGVRKAEANLKIWSSIRNSNAQ